VVDDLPEVGGRADAPLAEYDLRQEPVVGERQGASPLAELLPGDVAWDGPPGLGPELLRVRDGLEDEGVGVDRITGVACQDPRQVVAKAHAHALSLRAKNRQRSSLSSSCRGGLSFDSMPRISSPPTTTRRRSSNSTTTLRARISRAITRPCPL